MGDIDSGSLMYYRDAVSQDFHDHTTKEYNKVKSRSQKTNLQKCLLIYNSATLEWTVLFTDHTDHLF